MMKCANWLKPLIIHGAHPYKFYGNKKKTLALALPDEMRLCTMHMNAVTMMMSPMIV